MFTKKKVQKVKRYSQELKEKNFIYRVKKNTLKKSCRWEMLYNLFNFHATLKGNETFNGLIGIIKSFAGDKLGEYGDLIDNFAGIEVSYLGDGSFYLLPFNSSGKYYTVFKVKLVDILDLVISKLNVYKMLNDSQNDIVTFTKSNSVDEKNYSVDVVLNEDTVKSIKKGLEDFFNTTEGGMLKAMLQYADFGSLKIKLDVVDDKISKLTASFSYMKNVIDSTTSETKQEETTLANLVLETKALSYNFADLKKTKEISESYNKIIPLRDKMKALASTVYASNTYLKNVTDVLEEYAKLTDDEKVFFNSALVYNLENAKKNVADQLEFYKTYYKYDLNKMNNESIYELLSVYNKLKINSSLLSNEIGQDNYTKLIGLGSSVDYSKFDTIVPKIKGDNEKEWGLTSDDVKELKCIIQLAKIDSSVYNNVLLKFMVAGITLDLNTLETKLNNLTSIG